MKEAPEKIYCSYDYEWEEGDFIISEDPRFPHEYIRSDIHKELKEENISIRKVTDQRDMAIEVMKEVLEETGNRSLALYLAKIKYNQDGE